MSELDLELMTTSEIREMTPAEAIATFTGRAEKDFRNVQRIHRTSLQDNSLGLHALGRALVMFRENARKNGELYGRHLLLRLARSLGYESETPLRSLIDIAACWPTKEKFGTYANMVGPNGNCLTLTHLHYLAQVADEDKRLELANQTLEEHWTCAELLEERLRREGQRQITNCGRPRKRPVTVTGYLNDIDRRVQDLAKQAEKAWLDEESGLLKRCENTTPDELDEELITRIAATKVGLESLRGLIGQTLESVITVQARAQECIRAHEQATKTCDDSVVPADNQDSDLEEISHASS